MEPLEKAAHEIRFLEEQADKAEGLGRVPALVKVILTLAYMILTVSFGQYRIGGLIGMGIYPLAMFSYYNISFSKAIKRLKFVLPFLLLLGIANPFLDRRVFAAVGHLEISYGTVSLLTLLLKGLFTILAAYLLIVSTGMEKICGALEKLFVPSLLLTVLLLVYRYISVLLEETGRMEQAYLLRAPGQKTIGMKALIPFVGLLLLRSTDRAETVYESMCLRGFDVNKKKRVFARAVREDWRAGDVFFLLGWLAVLLLLRFLPVGQLVESLLPV